MKKTVSILLSALFVLSIGQGAFAVTKTATATKKVAKVVAKAPVKSAEVSAKGAVRNFTDKSITVIVNGKDVTYKIAGTTKVIQNDTPVAFLDAVQKGVYVTFKYMNTTNTITTITIPNAGAYGQGDLKMKLVDINVAMTDSSTAVSTPKVSPAFFVKSESQTREAAGIENADSFVYSNDGNMDISTGEKDCISLGKFEVVENSVKITLDGKEIKCLYGKATFDKSVVGDEALLIDDQDNAIFKIKFEKNLYEDDAKYSVEDLEKRLQVTYDKKIYKVTTYQITEFPLNDDVVCELNGKSATLAKVLNRANYSLITTNLAGEIVFVNGFYKDMYVRVDSVKGDKLTFSKMGVETDPASQVKFTDTVTISDGVTIQATTGAPRELSDLKAKDIIKITTEQEDGYRVTLIEKVEK